MTESIESSERILIDKESVMVIGEGTIVIRLNPCCGNESIEKMEEYLGKKFGRKVIVLESKYGEILTLPPEKT